MLLGLIGRHVNVESLGYVGTAMTLNSILSDKKTFTL